MKYLMILLTSFLSCSKIPDYEKMLETSANLIKYETKVSNVGILKENSNKNFRNGKNYTFLSDEELLKKGETFCQLKISKSNNRTLISMNLCSGATYTYYFNKDDCLDSLNVIFTKKNELSKADSICYKIFKNDRFLIY